MVLDGKYRIRLETGYEFVLTIENHKVVHASRPVAGLVGTHAQEDIPPRAHLSTRAILYGNSRSFSRPQGYARYDFTTYGIAPPRFLSRAANTLAQYKTF